jgi:hypothetical protein
MPPTPCSAKGGHDGRLRARAQEDAAHRQGGRKLEVNLAATLCRAIFTLGAVQRTGKDPNALLRTLRLAPAPGFEGLAEFPEWEGYLLDAKSILGAIE